MYTLSRVPRRAGAVAAAAVAALAMASGAIAAGPSPAEPADPDASAVVVTDAGEGADAEPVYRETFDGDVLPAGWSPVAGAWSVHDGRLHLDEPSAIARITFGEHLDNFRVEATIRFETVNNASRWAGVMTDVQPNGAIPWSQAVMRSQSTASNGTEFAIRTEADTWSVTDAGPAPTDAGTGRDVRVRIDVQGSNGRWYFDDELVLSTTRIPRTADGVLGIVADGSRISVDDVVVSELPPPSFVRDPALGPITIAHRGYSAIAPENTLAAVESALRTGAEMIEIDTYNSSDGATVVIHDATVDRTTDGTGAVGSLTAAEIAELDAGSWFSPAFVDEPVPTLEQVLDLIDGRGPKLLLEVKPGADREETRVQLEAVLDRGMAGQVVVQSFDAQVVRYAKELAPQIPRAYLVSALDADPVAVAEDLDLVAYNPNISALLGRPEIVEELHAAGVAVMPWTIDDTSTWSTLTELGVDGVITNKAGEHVGFRGGSPIEITPPAPEPNLSCAVDYTIHGVWPGGFNAQIRLSNTGDAPIDGWTLGWQFDAGESVRSGWSGDFTQDGAAVTVESLGWNRTIMPGATVPLGFIGGLDGAAPTVPAGFTVDGVPCAA